MDGISFIHETNRCDAASSLQWFLCRKTFIITVNRFDNSTFPIFMGEKSADIWGLLNLFGDKVDWKA